MPSIFTLWNSDLNYWAGFSAIFAIHLGNEGAFEIQLKSNTTKKAMKAVAKKLFTYLNGKIEFGWYF